MLRPTDPKAISPCWWWLYNVAPPTEVVNQMEREEKAKAEKKDTTVASPAMVKWREQCSREVDARMTQFRDGVPAMFAEHSMYATVRCFVVALLPCVLPVKSVVCVVVVAVVAIGLAVTI